MAGYDNFRSIGPVIANVHATELRTALGRRNLGAERPLLAGTCPMPDMRIPTQSSRTRLTATRRGAYADPHKNP